jgi:hemoglobin
MITRPDILNRNDISKHITSFYEKVRQDEQLAPVFSHVDWEHHTPIIIDFWSSLLLGDQSYKRNPFEKHISLPIDSNHFERWLQLFNQTIDELFSGERANEAKQRALSIAGIFQHKLGLFTRK